MAEDSSVGSESQGRASYLAGRFAAYAARPDVGMLREGRPKYLFDIARETAPEVPLDEVIEDVQAVARLVTAAERSRQGIPTAEITEIGPVPWIHPRLLEFPILDDWWEWSWREISRLRGAQLRVVPIPEALQAFERGLSAFLAHRIDGFHEWRGRQSAFSSTTPSTGTPPAPGGVAPGKTGFYVQLTCVHYHLAAHASPAYALTWRNLGSLTTPANGILPPGTWIFGAQGGVFPSVTYDPTPVHIPPTFTPCTTCF